MQRRLIYCLLAALIVGGGAVAAQTRATATNVATIPHEAVPNFFKNPPGIYTGENMGIATNSKGNIFIYHRANETRLFEYTPQGQFVREIGRNNYGFAFAHSVRVDTSHHETHPPSRRRPPRRFRRPRRERRPRPEIPGLPSG